MASRSQPSRCSILTDSSGLWWSVPDILLLFKVYNEGEDPRRVIDALKRYGKQNPNWTVPPLPAGNPDGNYSVTIASLGAFAPETYADNLDAWCRNALAGWDGHRIP